MTGKNWNNLYYEVLKANDELLGKEWSALKNNKEAAAKFVEGVKSGGWKKYLDAMASFKDSAIKLDASISTKAESLFDKIEEKWKSIHDWAGK